MEVILFVQSRMRICVLAGFLGACLVPELSLYELSPHRKKQKKSVYSIWQYATFHISFFYCSVVTQSTVVKGSAVR